MQKLFLSSTPLAVVSFVCMAFCTSVDAQWGTLNGRVLLDGDIPTIPLLVEKGNSVIRDAAICAARDIPDERLIVDPKTKGIANVIIYLAKKPANVYPDLMRSKNKEVTIDQKGCLFVPHVMLVRTDQQVRVLSDDSVPHSTHTHPSRNNLENFVMAANDRLGVVLKPMTLAERTPTRITCDIHSWTAAYWMILDHPYAAITDEKGHFEIANLPVGNHEFRIWQESLGFLEKRHRIAIEEGINEQKPLIYSVSQILK